MKDNMYPLKIKEKYDQDNLENLAHRFTTLYTGNYIAGDMREGVGSHPGVDIFPEKSHSNVYSVLDGVVEKVGDDGAYGNFIIIKHSNVPDPDNLDILTTLFSCYLHLSSHNVKVGDSILEGDIIGKTGDTGMSYGEHLHFQIDRATAPYHAYWPYTGSEVQDLGINFLEGVNQKLGYEKLVKYTVNPLVYLNKIDGLRISNKNTSKVENSSIIKGDIENNSNNLDINNTISLNNKEKDFDLTGDLDSLIDISNSVDNNLNNDINTNHSLDKLIGEDTDIELVINDDDLIKTKVILNDLNNNYKKFKDLKDTDIYTDYINNLYNQGKITGFSDNTFRPNSFITRAELLKIVLNMNNVSIINDLLSNFDDVSNNSWYNKYVNTALKLGLISTNNRLFRPNDRISRVEALKIVIKSLKIDISKGISCEYLDVNGTEWYAKYVNLSCKYNLIPGNGNYFYPNKNITRRELIGIFYNYEKNKD